MLYSLAFNLKFAQLELKPPAFSRAFMFIIDMCPAAACDMTPASRPYDAAAAAAEFHVLPSSVVVGHGRGATGCSTLTPLNGLRRAAATLAACMLRSFRRNFALLFWNHTWKIQKGKVVEFRHFLKTLVYMYTISSGKNN